MSKDFDLFVIGGGSGGVRAARASAAYGARVAIAEEYRYGGTCVIRGCVPKKLFVYASAYGHVSEQGSGFGWNFPAPTFDWNELVTRKDREIDRLNGIYIKLLADAGVQVFNGHARVEDAHTVTIGETQVTAETILIATGGTPFMPTLPGSELAITSNEAFHLPTFPNRVITVGGGYIAVEFAHIFRGLGAEVTLVHRGDQLLRGFDDDVRSQVKLGLERHGVELVLGCKAEALTPADGGGVRVRLSDGSDRTAQVALFATGRMPNTDIGLREIGVALGERGAVVVDEFSRTNIESIYAVGDCTDKITLTPVAIAEGQAFADSVFGGKPRPVDHDLIPSAVFCQPPAAVVGLTEAQAASQFRVAVYEAEFRPLKHTLSGSPNRSYMKLLVDADTDRVLGAHMVGEHAAEIIQCVAIAVKMHATKADFDRTTAVHPTTAEEFVLMRKPTRTLAKP